ncbi:MAG: hypothetical protein JRM86_03125, partial [Nitrososphaerota archaeon]|nr:hypothetical protein [Nitrososphaerota archaeon]
MNVRLAVAQGTPAAGFGVASAAPVEPRRARPKDPLVTGETGGLWPGSFGRTRPTPPDASEGGGDAGALGGAGGAGGAGGVAGRALAGWNPFVCPFPPFVGVVCAGDPLPPFPLHVPASGLCSGIQVLRGWASKSTTTLTSGLGGMTVPQPSAHFAGHRWPVRVLSLMGRPPSS